MTIKEYHVLKSFIESGERVFPLFYDSDCAISVSEWVQEHEEELEEITLKFGGYLLSNFLIKTVSDFNSCAQSLMPQLLDYTQASTPRTQLEGKIYTSTEFRADKEIPFHNEKSYSKQWPNKILFFCVTPSHQGGETPIADSRRVLERINHAVVEEFERKGVLYTRSYNEEFDLNWQKVFQTEDHRVVESFCKKQDIECEWDKLYSVLRTKQRCQATLLHPLTHEKVWFNQAHIFHISIYEGKEREELAQLKEEDLPRNAYFGDGTPIEEEVLNHIRLAYQQEAISFQWKPGDLLILDNILMAHSRKPFKGDRKIAVAMG